MTSSDHQQDALEKFCHLAVQSQIGDISTLPNKLRGHIQRIYAEFITSYLDLMRQKENKPVDWFPPSWSIDPELADDMRHFFSDYQHITKKFYILNTKLSRLKKIDRVRQPNLYRHAVEDILRLNDRTPGKGT